MMESIEKLRKHMAGYDFDPDAELYLGNVLDYLVAIEQEIAERYVELPVDADGVPWHIGDMGVGVHQWRGDVFAVGSMEYEGDGWLLVDAETSDSIRATDARHQPDSWDRIIEDAVKMGVYDHDNERIKAKLIERCRALAGDAE